MTNYQRGYNFELRVRKWYERRGFFVIRSSGSHGIADLVALKKGRVVLIQCKIDGYLSPDERNEIIRVKDALQVEAVLAHRKGRDLILDEIPESLNTRRTPLRA